MNLTTDEITLLRQVFTWTRANGIRWTDVRDGECARCRVWKSADGRREVHAWDRLESDDDLGIFVKRDNVSQGLELRDVREIVDVLCALDVLPARFSSQHQAGAESLPWHYGVQDRHDGEIHHFGEDLARAMAYATPVDDYPALTVLRWRQGPRQMAVSGAADAVAGRALAEREVAGNA